MSQFLDMSSLIQATFDANNLLKSFKFLKFVDGLEGSNMFLEFCPSDSASRLFISLEPRAIFDRLWVLESGLRRQRVNFSCLLFTLFDDPSYLLHVVKSLTYFGAGGATAGS